MNKTKAKKLLKEFETIHNAYSVSNLGRWYNWRKVLKFAELKSGYWYWRGHRICDLHNIIKYNKR